MVGARGYPLTPNLLADSRLLFIGADSGRNFPDRRFSHRLRIKSSILKYPRKQKEHESYTHKWSINSCSKCVLHPNLALAKGAALSGDVALCDCRFRTIAVSNGSAMYILQYFAIIVNDFGLKMT